MTPRKWVSSAVDSQKLMAGIGCLHEFDAQYGPLNKQQQGHSSKPVIYAVGMGGLRRSKSKHTACCEVYSLHDVVVESIIRALLRSRSGSNHDHRIRTYHQTSIALTTMLAEVFETGVPRS